MQNLSSLQAIDKKRKKRLIHRNDLALSITTIYKYKPIKQSNEKLFEIFYPFRMWIKLWINSGWIVENP